MTSFAGTSSFDAVDLFGSGPHQVLVDGLEVARRRGAFAGCNGFVTATFGGRGRPVQIRGKLIGTDYDDLQDQIAAIEEACRSWGECDLVYLSYTYNYVELDLIQCQPSRYVVWEGSWVEMCEYVVTGRQNA